MVTKPGLMLKRLNLMNCFKECFLNEIQIRFPGYDFKETKDDIPITVNG